MRVAALAALLIAVQACSPAPAPRHTTVNALGEPSSLAQFAGQYVWVDYAAEWCAACDPQSKVIRTLANGLDGEVVFVTIMTSEKEGYGHPATQATAADWAARYSLAPDRVFAADLTSMTLPQHALFAPDGQEIYRYTGSMSAKDITTVLETKGIKK